MGAKGGRGGAGDLAREAKVGDLDDLVVAAAWSAAGAGSASSCRLAAIRPRRCCTMITTTAAATAAASTSTCRRRDRRRRRQQQVFRLQVAVEEAGRVDVREAGEHLAQPRADARLGERRVAGVLHELVEVALHELEHEEELVALADDLAQAHDAGVARGAAQRLDLAQRRHVLSRVAAALHALDGDRLGRRAVVGLEDARVRALAELAHDAVAVLSVACLACVAGRGFRWRQVGAQRALLRGVVGDCARARPAVFQASHAGPTVVNPTYTSSLCMRTGACWQVVGCCC